jgi:integrase
LLELGAAAVELLSSSPQRTSGRHESVNPRGSVKPGGRGWYLRLHGKPRIFLGRFCDVRSEAAARAIADAYLARSRPQVVKHGPVVAVSELLERFLRLAEPGLRPSSLDRYTRLVRNLAIPEIGSLRIEQLDTARLRQLFADLATRGVARSTLVSLRTVLVRAIADAGADGFAVRMIDSKRLKISLGARVAREIRPVTTHELDSIIASSSGADRVAYALMGYLGLRISEALGLRWVDVDYRRHEITIRQAVVNGKVQKLKTDRSLATLPMIGPLEQLLHQYQRLGPVNAYGLVVASCNGEPVHADNLRARRWNTLLKRLGMPPRGFHSLRHGLSKILTDLGATEAVVRAVLRHTSAAMSQKYTHTGAQDIGDALSGAAQRLERDNNSQQNVPNRTREKKT